MKNGNKETNDEITPDVDDLPADDVEIDESEALLSDKLRVLKDKLKVCEREKADHLENLQRVKADFLNSKRRLEDQLTSDRQRISRDYIESLLPLCDSFEMAISDTDSWESVEENWRTGIKSIYTQLQNILKTANVEEIVAEGMPFNPHEHEAMSHEKVEDATQIDIVMSVLQKGYKQGDYIIRPSKVTVGITE